MSTANPFFAHRMKEHQIVWASMNGLDHLLETGAVLERLEADA